MVEAISCQCRGAGLIPGWGTEIPHGVGCSQKIKKKKKVLTNFCNLLGQNNVPDTERKKQLAFLHHRSWKVPGGRVRAGTGQS